MKNLLKLLTKALMVLMVATMFTACDFGANASAESDDNTPAETTPTKVTGDCREGDAYCECHMTSNGTLYCELNWHMYD